MGSRTTPATRAEVQALLTAVYGSPGAYEARYAAAPEHLVERLRVLRAFVAGLPGGGPFTPAGAEY